MGKVNIHTQSTFVPDRIGSTYNPTPEQLRADGWRDMPVLPPVADGYERSAPVYVEGDGITAKAIYTDTLIADRLAAEAAATIEANRALWTLENQYLAMCDQLSGTTDHAKLGFSELTDKINAMNATSPGDAVTLALRLLTLNAALVRAGGVLWWDSCEWHKEVEQ